MSKYQKKIDYHKQNVLTFVSFLVCSLALKKAKAEMIFAYRSQLS
jgi:hypothetical protein